MCVLPSSTTLPPDVQEELGRAAAAQDQLQAQLDAAERRAAVLQAGQGPSLPELEGMLRRLSGQRDAAQIAAADAQARLQQREAEVVALQQQVAQLEQAAAAGEASGRFVWPTSLSSTESLDVAEAPPPGDPAALYGALEAERQQNVQLQAALRALTADMQCLQQQQQQQLAVVPAAQVGALADVTNTPQQQAQQHQQQEVQRLAKQLAWAQARLRQLAGENERLMEMSNSLRAERNRLARAAQQPSGAASGSDDVAWGTRGRGEMLPALVPGLLPAVPPLHTPPLQLWPLLAQPAAGSLVPIQLAAAGNMQPAQAASPAQQQQQQQQQLCHQVDQQQQLGAEQPRQGSAQEAPTESGSAEPDMALMGQSLLPQATPHGGTAAAAGTRRAVVRVCSKQSRALEPTALAGRQGSVPSPPCVRNWNIKSP